MLIRKKLSLIEFGAIIGNVGLLGAIGLAII